MAVKQNQWAQSEIDRHNRYLKRYSGMSNPNQAHVQTYNNIMNMYGKDSLNKNGLLDVNNFSGKSERQYRTVNPYSQYTKNVDMKYLNNIDGYMKNNQGVSDPQMSQYNALKEKWNYQGYDPVKEANKPINFDDYKTESATIDDLAKKYGFDYSRDYAKRQAEAEAQARRNAVENQKNLNESSKKENLQSIDNNLMSMAEGLDRNYFQKYMQQAQGQVNSGINSGIAADQDLRLAMSRQAEMGDAYRDANLGRMNVNNSYSDQAMALAAEMGLIDQQALAREDSLHNDRLNQAFGQIMDLNQFNQSENMASLELALKNRGMDVDLAKYMKEFAYQEGRDERKDAEWESQQKYDRYWDKVTLDYQKQRDSRKDSEWESEQKYGRYWDKFQYDNISAADRARMSQDQSQFNTSMDWDKFQWDNLSASDQADMEMRMRELQQALESGATYSDLSPELKAFIDSGGTLQNHSVAGIGFKNGSLGSLSAKYESSGDIGTIANNQGDLGGKSYGKYQIATNTGTMKGFMSWLKQTDASFYQALARNSAGSSGFDATWKALASNYPEKFEQLQHGFIKSTHYDPVVTSLTNGIGLNVNKRSGALQNVIWSLGVQHGAGGASNLVKAAGVKPGMNDRQIIDAIYRERSKVDKYFSRSSSSIRKSVYNRFQREWEDAISMLG